MMKSFLVMAIAACGGAAAFAVNTLEQEFTCPIDGKHWKQRIESSSGPRGLRLDLRLLGDVVDPPTLPQCPKCHFPLFSDQLAAPVIERLKPFVLGTDFQMFAVKNPSYFSLAQVQKHLRAPHRYIALSYLRASWQIEERDAACRRLLEMAHTHFTAALAEMKLGDRQYTDLALQCGEIERRLGKWEQAEQRFRDMEGGKGLEDARLKPIVALQLKLIELRDPAPRAMDTPIAKLAPHPGAPEPEFSLPTRGAGAKDGKPDPNLLPLPK